MKGISLPSYLDMWFEFGMRRLSERPDFSFIATLKHPTPVIDGFEVFVFDPVPRFGRVSSGGPSPQSLEDGMVYFGKCCAAGDMLMIECPASNDRIKEFDEFSSGHLFIGGDDFSNFGEEDFDVLGGRFDAQTFLVTANVLSEKIEPFFDMRETGLVW